MGSQEPKRLQSDSEERLQKDSDDSDQPAWMRPLIRMSAWLICNLVGNAVPRLKCHLYRRWVKQKGDIYKMSRLAFPKLASFNTIFGTLLPANSERYTSSTVLLVFIPPQNYVCGGWIYCFHVVHPSVTFLFLRHCLWEISCVFYLESWHRHI